MLPFKVKQQPPKPLRLFVMLGDQVKMQVDALAFKEKLKIYLFETEREWRNKTDFEELLAMEVKNWFSSP